MARPQPTSRPHPAAPRAWTPWALLLLLGGLPGPARAQGLTPREVGQALKERLAAAPPRMELVGTTLLGVRLGQAEVGSLRLGTQVVEHEGQQVYRLLDALRLDLPGWGTLSLTVQADLRADLTPLEVVLRVDEPVGGGQQRQRRVTLSRRDGRWLREVVEGEAPPSLQVLSELPEDALVLTPPLGAGERLVRLAGLTLGERLSLAGFDLETGQPASLRLSCEDSGDLNGRPALWGLRQEGAAELELAWGPDGLPRQLRLGGRVLALERGLEPPPAQPPGEVAAVLELLGAIARADRAALARLLDLDALYAEAGGPEDDAAFRRSFAEALLARLTASEGREPLDLALLAAGPDDLEAGAPDEGGRVAVRLRADPGCAFLLVSREGSWRIVRLPR